MAQGFVSRKLTGVILLTVLLICTALTCNAADLLTCTHKTGAIVYTRTPSVLSNDFICAGKAANKAYGELPAAQKLDPTPSITQFDSTCPSSTTININSSGYSGSFAVELRRGNRPGSKRLNGGTASNGGALKFENVCPGNYFYAFGPSDSESVSVTRYFVIKNEAGSYNNPVITVFYSKATPDGSNRLQQAKKSDL